MSARSDTEHWHREWSNERGERIKADARITSLERELAERDARIQELGQMVRDVNSRRVVELQTELAEANVREERKDRLLQECRGHLKGWKMSMLASTPERLLAKIEAVLQQKGDTND